ncbi:MAG: CBS domain-containing protein [Pseudotabrizicola sp.]|uniref:CBS domain-containing protein n=1 Tax=Pseudotabrizicola sp. TaxID=2939647 RepID=UPI002728CAAA|nr:CBS domain-containing protein [Pseudotabrizicola sp.]MDO8884912.1 CBS domain-containing protein [Pseudotabrizicola sp.]MDP2082734.1 CBS domain-containing protein [Pseudotabrizicola sp.]MDZ7576293.1 CBS domain-containing protein [Pseudotabrizicola sp.]
MIVQQILKLKASNEVTTVPPGTDVSHVAEILASRKIGTVVVSSDGKTILGIVSERDIVAEVARNGNVCLIAPVEAIMTKAVQCCKCAESADSVLERMTTGRFRHMPVVDAAGDEMVGLISIGDVVKARLMELAAEKDALEGMIKGF